MRSNNIFSLLISLFILNACANIQPPSGGPKDENPPALVNTAPKQGQLNFDKKEIIFSFDELIQPNNLQEQILITPLINSEDYETLVKKNNLHLIFKKPLKDSTTYTINLRQGVKDLTEGNTTENLTLTFSTGNYLDSIKLAGTVKDLLTKKNQEAINVALYQAGDTSNITNSKPLYLTKTDKSGAFVIKNIKNGNYDIYALNDKNKNLLYNEGEKVAFEKNINLDSNRIDILLQLGTTDTTPPRLIKNLAREANYEIQFNEGIKSIKLLTEADSDSLVYKKSKDGKVFTIFNTKFIYDTIPTYVFAEDSTGNLLQDTLNIVFPKKEEKSLLTYSINPENKKLNPNEIKIILDFNKPIISFFKENIKLLQDTSKTEIENLNITERSATEIEISTEGKLKEPINLIIKDSTFLSYDSLTNSKADTLEMTLMKEEDYGSIKGTVTTEHKSYFIELLNENYEVVRRDTNIVKLNYNYINPGTYYIRAKIDENNNGKWDGLNLFENLHAEPVLFYRDPIQIRANWEILDINFSF